MVQTSPSRLGRYVTTTTAGEQVRAFLPPTLPPDPAVDLGRLQRRLERASQALGRLDGLTRLLPDPQIFIYLYVRKEAVLSSQIEGTQSSLSDLLSFEAEEMQGVLLDDVTEVSSYVAALEHGLRRIRGDLPLSLRLFASFTRSCCVTGAGPTRCRASFGARQNWIGGTRPGNAAFVPPPPEYLMNASISSNGFFTETTQVFPCW